MMCLFTAVVIQKMKVYDRNFYDAILITNNGKVKLCTYSLIATLKQTV